MGDSVHRDNGRHKPLQGQYKLKDLTNANSNGQPLGYSNFSGLCKQPSMKQIIAERDAAIQERNMANSERKAALAERDMALLQRDSAVSERNNAIIERDAAIATLQYRENSMGNGSMSTCSPGCQIFRGVKHLHLPQQHMQNQSHLGEAPFSAREMHTSEVIPTSPIALEPAKSRQPKRTKEVEATALNKKKSRSSQKGKKENEDLNQTMFGKSQEWKGGQEMSIGLDDLNTQAVSKPEWKNQDLGLNRVAFDESTMPVPICSCTGSLRTCYKWGNGGWQSSCCTTTLSMYPLPTVPHKRHARVGGRKMSGSAYNKLISRLASEGHDLSNAVDLRDHWAKHGTNRYITIK